MIEITKKNENEKIESDVVEEKSTIDADMQSEQQEKVPVENGKGNKNRGTFLMVVLALQIILIIFMLIKFSKPENQNIMILETSIEKGDFTDPDDFVLTRYDILDTITLLSGTEADGRAVEENSLRKNMVFDSGQAMWLLFEEKIKEDEKIFEYSRGVMEENDFKTFKEKVMSDEVINIIYDMGESEDTYRPNWREVGVKELQAAPFLPWKKKIDFIILSSFEDKHWGGMSYILKFNPAIPIICPPLTKEDVLKNSQILDRAHNLIPILPGYSRLTSRLSALVTSIPMGKGKDPRYELDLVLDIEGGVAIIAGSGLLEPLEIVKKVKEETGKKVLYYIGGTNLLVGLESEELRSQMEELKRIAPEMKIYPNFNTSMIARQMLKEVFEDKCHDAPLGLKIRFKKDTENNRKGKDGK